MMQPSNASSICSSIPSKHCVEHMHGRTDGTNEDSITAKSLRVSVSNAHRGAEKFAPDSNESCGRPDASLGLDGRIR